jgi:long-chain acyl-CoA synthetase
MSRQFADLFFDKVKSSPKETALQYFETSSQTWTSLDWEEYGRLVAGIAGWLKNHGIGRGDRVGILSPNRPEWLITDLAILSAGAVSVPIYATSSQKDLRYILEHSGAKALFTDNVSRIKALAGGSGAPNALPAVVVAFDAPAASEATDVPGLKTFGQLIDAGSPALETPLTMREDELATIIYTSGTTGNPKGVLHTHGNLLAVVPPVLAVLDEGRTGPDRFFSFLPLSHVAERVLVEIGSIASGSEVAFARSVDTLGEDLARFRPTILLCVPRLWERVHEKIVKGLDTASPLKRRIFKLAQRWGSCRIADSRILKGRDSLLRAKLSDALVGKKLRARLGMDRVRLFLTGSAPTRAEILKFFGSFGIVIREVYGLTENLCLGVYTKPDQTVIGSCGLPFNGNEVKIAADGEILFRAPWMFKGYYRNEEATREVLLPDRWFATGDLGAIDAEGRLRITGRKKELLKTSTGKYVAPVPIEDQLKLNPVIADAMLVGDNEKYCVALVAVDTATAKPGSPEMEKILKDHLDRINSGLAHHESIKKVGVIKQPFSVEAGTLTPSFKLKRKAALTAYSQFIMKVYEAKDLVVYES